MSVLRAVRMLLSLRCEESTRIMSDDYEREISGIERWAVRLHFISCRACRRFRRQIAFLQQAARTHLQFSTILPAERRDRIARRINGD